MILISTFMRRFANVVYWQNNIKEKFGVDCYSKEDTGLDPIILRQTYFILSRMTPNLVKACGINKLFFSTVMGPNRPYYPNHGYYIGDRVVLNSDIFYHPDINEDFFDSNGYFLDRPTQTILHEFGHAFDAHNGDLSLRNDWLCLSAWSKTPEKGLKRLVIQEIGAPVVYGEWFFSPKAKFTRFYGKRNPYDDWADCFAFFVGNLKDKVPENKRLYFNNLLQLY